MDPSNLFVVPIVSQLTEELKLLYRVPEAIERAAHTLLTHHDSREWATLDEYKKDFRSFQNFGSLNCPAAEGDIHRLRGQRT